jgi:hypothetical protein
MLRWIDRLDDEDLSFLKKFVLASGSLKELASGYGVSYPTIRLRLDRLIAKIEIFESDKPMSEFERTARALAADGKLEPAALKALLSAHQEELENQHEQPAPQKPATPRPRQSVREY